VSGTTYTLDINVFRLVFKDIEDDSTGIPYVDTHSHNGKVIISGVTYARFIQIINGYTVDCSGANHNLNDVSVYGGHFTLVPNNSSGLVSNTTPQTI
jgi:hypothetical protein